MALVLASCHSSKKVVTNNNAGVQTPANTVVNDANANGSANQQQNVAPKETNFTAKVKVAITRGDQNLATNGMLRMRYNDVIQLTLVDPILGITEVGRMELSPSNILIIDRINKRYVSTSYDEFSATRDRHIDFNTIQELFWNESQKSDKLTYDIPAGKSSIKLDLKLSDKGNSANWEPHTNVSSKYTKTDAEKLFKSLVQ